MNFFKSPRVKKYQRVALDGYSFASKLEASLYGELKLRERAKEIRILGVQNTVYLSLARIRYIPDFWVELTATGQSEWHEAKGFESERWPIIKKLWAFYGPGKLYIYKGTYQRLRLDEVITPVSP